MQPSLRLGRWGSSILPLGKRQCSPFPRVGPGYSIRFQSTPGAYSQLPIDVLPAKRGRPRKMDARSPRHDTNKGEISTGKTIRTSSKAANSKGKASSQPLTQDAAENNDGAPPRPKTSPNGRKLGRPLLSSISPEHLPSPHPQKALTSAKLAALHARLSLPPSLSMQTLARCLVDGSADPDSRFNNHHLSNLGNDLLGYYLGEYFVCHYPRLPMVVLQAAMQAHVGPPALQALAHSWGVESAGEPGGEVDPGLLQFRRTPPSKRDDRVVDILQKQAQERSGTLHPIVRTLEIASSFFCRAIVAAVYLHGGAERVKEFIQAHFLSRKLDLHSLFTFTQPTRDLSRLCAREGFDAPVARIMSESGRLSRHPVFVVGIYSGRDMIGQDAGASLNEARFKASAKALKGWYLYSPRNAVGGGAIMVPSMMEGKAGQGRTWRKPHIDDGEVVG